MEATIIRIKRRPDFLRVASKRHKWAAKSLVLQAAPTPRSALPAPADNIDQTDIEPTLRVGFTVTKKVGNAVVRNRVKRRLRAAVDQIMPTLAKPGWDYVVIGRGQCLHRPFDQVLQDLQTALKRLNATRSP